MIYLRCVEQIAQIILLGCLFRRSLARNYPLFTAYLMARILRAISFLPLNYHDFAYAKAWALTEPVLLVFQCLVVMELTQMLLEYYPEIAHVAKVLVGWSLAIGAVLGGSLAVVAAAKTRQPIWLAAVLGVWKWCSLSCALALILQSAWFSAFPFPMRGNVSVHRWMLTMFIGVVPACSSFFVEWKALGWEDTVVFLQVLIETACCLSWAFLLQKSGEQIRYRVDWIARGDGGRIRCEYMLFVENLRRKLSVAHVLDE